MAVDDPTLTALDAALCKEAVAFLREFFRGTTRQRSRRLAKAPLRSVQVAALRHPDPLVRKKCLFFLDHYANDHSIAVFSAALGDPVDFVRILAMHSLTCTSCKVGALDAAEVAPGSAPENDLDAGAARSRRWRGADRPRGIRAERSGLTHP